MSLGLVLTLCIFQPWAIASTPCNASTAVISNSNRTASAPCVGNLGDECHYQCNAGYLAIGRHVCQSYTAQPSGKPPVPVLQNVWFGGRCQRLCPSSVQSCSSDLAAVRQNTTENGTSCFTTVCLDPDTALRRLARGAYEVFRRARNPRTGIYIGYVDLNPGAWQPWNWAGQADMSGLGVQIECVAAALGFTSVQNAQADVKLTLQALAGRLPGFNPKRNPHGWQTWFMNSDSGDPGSVPQFSTISTAISAAGALFAKTYFERVDPGSNATLEISELGDHLWHAVDWDTLLCDNGVEGRGTGIPWIMGANGGCSNWYSLDSDGLYEFAELSLAQWFAFVKGCDNLPVEQCTNEPIKNMWKRVQGRRFATHYSYAGHPLLTMWPCYTLQIPFYLAHPLNSDPTYKALFKSHWQAEWAYYNSSAFYAGEEGRYGLGAGPLDPWCSGGSTYGADLLSPSENAQGCRMYSPYAVAGWLPANPELIRSHLLSLLASGDPVLGISGTPYYILWRKSLIAPSWSQGYGITLVDFVSEIWGLSTLWLGLDFYTNNTNHWKDNSRPISTGSVASTDATNIFVL